MTAKESINSQKAKCELYNISRDAILDILENEQQQVRLCAQRIPLLIRPEISPILKHITLDECS